MTEPMDPYLVDETCDECETTGVNCPLHSGPEWRRDQTTDPFEGVDESYNNSEW